MKEHQYQDAEPVSGGGDKGRGNGEPHSIYPERRVFDRMLASISARCLNAPIDQLDREIETSLKETTAFFHGDRALLWEISEDGRRATFTHGHAEEGFESPAELRRPEALQVALPYIFDAVLAHQNLCISSLDDLPQAAHIDRQYLDRSGIRSFIVIPMLVGGLPRGALSFACIRTARSWDNTDLFHLQRIAIVLASALDRRRSHRLLDQRMRFETMIADLSANIMRTPLNEIDGEIERGLARVAEFFQVDRCGLLRVDHDSRSAWVSHAWYMEGVERVSGDINLAALFPWNYEKLVVQGSHVNTTRLKELPPEADTDRQTYTTMGVRSSLDIPVSSGASVSHIVVIQALREEREWPEEYVPRLRLLGELFVNALERQKADMALRRSEERFRQVAENVGDFIWEVDAKGLYRYTSPAVETILGYTPDELIGRMHFYDLFVPEIRDELKAAAFKVFAAKQSFRAFPNPNVSKDGKIVHLETSGVPVLDNAGNVVGYRGSDSDITERKQFQDRIQAAADEWHRTFNTIQDLIMILDREFRIVQVNDAAVKFFGLPQEKIIGVPCYRLMHGTEHPMDGCPYEKMLETKGHEETDVYDEPRGMWFHVVVDPLLDGKGEVTGVVHTVKDITARKRAEEELRKACAEIATLKDKLEAENIYLREEIGMSRENGAIIGRSDAIKYVLYRIGQVAPMDTTVLIVGETGTGKGLVARAVHEGSLRKDLPMVHVNCAVLPANLIESELFGREKGAFTGAHGKQIGRFELAHKGTIFLDEIAELPVELQAKLLRIIDSGEFERLGSPRTVKVDVRIIAATNRNLDEEVRKGRFREDLYYRLNVFPITVPPLRQRTEDIPLMVSALVDRMNKQMGKRITTVSREVEQILKSYAWPGNVRELENIIGRAVITTHGPVLRLAEGLGEGSPRTSEPREAMATGLMEMERSHILKTLEAMKWKIEGPTGAAQALGLKPSTLRTRMEKLDIRRPKNS